MGEHRSVIRIGMMAKNGTYSVEQIQQWLRDQEAAGFLRILRMDDVEAEIAVSGPLGEFLAAPSEGNGNG